VANSFLTTTIGLQNEIVQRTFKKRGIGLDNQTGKGFLRAGP